MAIVALTGIGFRFSCSRPPVEGRSEDRLGLVTGGRVESLVIERKRLFKCNGQMTEEKEEESW